jgi:hypothetical protein
MKCKSVDFLDTTGNNSTIQLLKSKELSYTVLNNPVAIWSADLIYTVAQEVQPGDYLMVGFGLEDFNSTSSPSNRLTVSWSLSAYNS